MSDTVQNGKGSTHRPSTVTDDVFERHWEDIYGNRKKKWTVCYAIGEIPYKKVFNTRAEAQAYYNRIKDSLNVDLVLI